MNFLNTIQAKIMLFAVLFFPVIAISWYMLTGTYRFGPDLPYGFIKTRGFPVYLTDNNNGQPVYDNMAFMANILAILIIDVVLSVVFAVVISEVQLFFLKRKLGRKQKL